jgi:hypothetical protein
MRRRYAEVMNNGISESSQTGMATGSTRASRVAASSDELTRLKRELLQAEVRLAKARATMVTAEIDIKVLSTRLKELTRG